MLALRLMIRSVVMLSVCLGAGLAAFAQQTPRTDDVVRINTDLVQTDVMVFAKDGSFVDRLKREQFELKVDGRPREISFFERVASGSRNEEAQLAAARGTRISANGAPVPLDRGRTVFFFLDDIHLSNSSVVYARAMLTRFVDHQMGQNDEVAIFSTSGSIGFLQQLTDNKAVLHAAIERLRSLPSITRDGQRPPMSEYQALLVDHNDTDIIGFYIDEILKDNPGLPRQLAGDMVRQRANAILLQAGNYTQRSLSSLESLSRSVGQMPGRKLLILVSDGFLVDNRNTGTLDRIHRISSAAARSGVVIYSIDARGLVVGMPDASSEVAVDPTGRLTRASIGEISASQDGLSSLARDTGGRALFNSNDLSGAVATAVKETSVYYLLAWRPENEEERIGRFKRIEVGVTGRPELSVRLRRNYGESPVATREPARRKASAPNEQPKVPPDEVRESLLSSYPRTALATSVAANFLDLPVQGAVVTASMKIALNADQFSIVDDKPVATFVVAGLVVNDKGKVVSSFRERLTLKGSDAHVELGSVDGLFYNYRAKVTPGLYQIRVAARDEKNGRNGSAMKWIEIPDLTTRHLALSSILAGERPLDLQQLASAEEGQQNTNTEAFKRVRLNVDNRFARSSLLRFLVFTYNAANSDAAPAAPGGEASTGLRPDIAVQVQVLRDNEPVLTTPLRKIDTEGVADLGRLPYAADVPLAGLPAGHYLLKVTIIDRVSRSSASQQLGFEVD